MLNMGENHLSDLDDKWLEEDHDGNDDEGLWGDGKEKVVGTAEVT